MPHIANTFKWTWHWRDNGGRDYFNVWYVEGPTGSAMTPTLAGQITAALRAELAATTGRTAAWRAYINNGSGLNDQSIIANDGVSSFEYIDNTVVLGTSATDPLPPQTCLLVQKKTGLAGRHNRGRCYLGPFAEGFNDGGGFPTAALRADVLTSLEAVRTTLVGLGTPIMLISQRPGLVEAHEVTSFTVGTAWRSQRRRALQS